MTLNILIRGDTLKKIISFLFAIMLLVLPSSAHPGRTDLNGGHWNRSTGEYHYHDGKYAGREQSPSDSSSSAYDSFTPPHEPPTENLHTNPKPSEEKGKKLPLWFYIVLFVLAVPIALFIYAFMRVLYDEFISKKLPRYKIHNYDVILHRFYYSQQDFMDVQLKLLSLEFNKDIENYTCRKNKLTSEFEYEFERASAVKKEAVYWHNECNTRFVKFLLLFSKKNRIKLDELNKRYYNAMLNAKT